MNASEQKDYCLCTGDVIHAHDENFVIWKPSSEFTEHWEITTEVQNRTIPKNVTRTHAVLLVRFKSRCDHKVNVVMCSQYSLTRELNPLNYQMAGFFYNTNGAKAHLKIDDRKVWQKMNFSVLETLPIFHVCLCKLFRRVNECSRRLRRKFSQTIHDNRIIHQRQTHHQRSIEPMHSYFTLV